MLTSFCLLGLAYACRRPVYWISARMIAFAVGFVIGWQVMDRR